MTQAGPSDTGGARAPRPDARPTVAAATTTALVVLTPDVLELRHVSLSYPVLHGLPDLPPGTSTGVFSVHLPPELVAHIVTEVASSVPRSFSYEVAGRDGVVRAMEARLIAPYGGGRPVVFEVWPAGTTRRDGALAPHPELAPVLDSFAGAVHPAALLETTLLCALEVSGLDALAVVAPAPAPDATPVVLAAVDGAGVVAPDHAQAHPDGHPRELAVTDDGFRLVGRGAGAARPLGRLGEATFRAARATRESSPLGRPFPAPVADAPRPATVVYVDDDPASRELLVELFKLLPALDLVAVAGQAEAHAAIAAHRPAVVISDAWLGEESAEPFVTGLLAGSQLDAPAVVMLSADANAATIARFRRLGISSYLSKPIQLDRLAAVVTDLANSVCADEGNRASARTNAASGN